MRIETVDPRELSEGLDSKTYWRVFCSFLDLDPEGFQEIQDELLMNQVRAMASTPLGQYLFWGTVPRDPHEFRLRVPLTSYHDYLPFLCDNSSVFSPERISFWARGFLSGNAYKRVPYTEGATRALLHSLFAALILSSATAKGEVQVRKGDRVLAELRELLAQLVSTPGFAARYGGEEFVVVLPGTTRDEAQRCGEFLAEKIASHPFEGAHILPQGRLTASFGLACYPEDGETADELLSAADRSMYREKDGQACAEAE